MSARVFVHPRCWTEPGVGVLTERLMALGFGGDELCVGPLDKRGRRDLCRMIEKRPDGALVLEQMDGVRFEYRPIDPPRSAA